MPPELTEEEREKVIEQKDAFYIKSDRMVKDFQSNLKLLTQLDNENLTAFIGSRVDALIKLSYVQSRKPEGLGHLGELAELLALLLGSIENGEYLGLATCMDICNAIDVKSLNERIVQDFPANKLIRAPILMLAELAQQIDSLRTEFAKKCEKLNNLLEDSRKLH